MLIIIIFEDEQESKQANMKNIFTFIITGLIASVAFAQSPEKISYQAVIRDVGNGLVVSSTIGMQISILQGSSSGTSVYVETQTPTSNSNGLVNVEIGGGSVVSGNFSSIDWAYGPYFIKTETDPNGGTTYTVTGVSQLLSVPYALHSKYAEHLVQDTTTDYIHTDTIDNFIVKISNGDHPFFDIASTNEAYNPISQQTAIVGVSKDNHNPLDSNDTRALVVHTDAQRKLTKTVVCEPGELTISVQNDSLGALNLNPFQAVIQMKDAAKEILIGNAYLNPDQQNAISLTEDETTLFFTDDDGVTYRGFQFSNDGLKLVDTGTITFSSTMQGVTTINDVLKITPRTSAPPTPDKGTVYFDDVTNKLMVYDGTTWQACW